MPVIVASEEIHPFLPSSGGAEIIDRARAETQDIRPLEFAILNLMADKVATERQLALWLGHTPLQIRLTFIATDRYVRDIENGRESKNTPSEHIRKFYSGWSEIKNQKFDGLIVTGVNALKDRVTDEVYWDEVQEILRWSETNAFSSLFLCWGAKAALKHFHDIDSIKGDAKTWGLFEHRIVSDKTGLLFGFPDRFSIPISRWKNPDVDAIAACPKIETLAYADEVGPNILAEPALYADGKMYPKRVYVLNHPEYETDSLLHEYQRDREKNKGALPLHYFPKDDPNIKPVNTWRHTGFLYANWVHTVYEATPYDMNEIPRPMRAR